METHRRKLHIPAAVILLLLLLGGCAAANTGDAAAPDPAVTPAPRTLTVSTPPPAAELGLRLAAGDGHPALMKTDGSGAFCPERPVSRSALCELLRPLVEGLPEGTPAFTDYRLGNAGYRAAAALFAAGFLPDAEGGAFRPSEDATRGELSYILRRLAAALPDDEGARAAALAAEVAAGATSRTGAAASEDEPILREELAVVLERLMGREPREAALFLGEYLPADIDQENYAWAYIADAVTDSEPPEPSPGVHRAYGWLYAVWEDGTLIRDMDYGVWTFGLDGGYTTGDAELDGYLAQALEESGANDLPDREALQAVYLYVKYYGEYLVRPEDMETPDVGAMGWEYDRALRFFRYGGGTCYGYAAAFGILARTLGQTAYVVSAEVNQYHGDHAFVVIPEDGTDWLYDVELEATRPERHPDLELFHIRNYTIYFYWYEPDWV